MEFYYLFFYAFPSTPPLLAKLSPEQHQLLMTTGRRICGCVRQERTLAMGLIMSDITQIGPAVAQLLSARIGSSLQIAPVVLIILSLTASGPDNLPMGSIKKTGALTEAGHSRTLATWLLHLVAICGDTMTLATPNFPHTLEAFAHALSHIFSITGLSQALV